VKIGELRRSLFTGWDSRWNGLVREITAIHEKTEEEVDEIKVYRVLILAIKSHAEMDKDFPRDRHQPSRLEELFQESK
jgi:hypothetical protein